MKAVAGRARGHGFLRYFPPCAGLFTCATLVDKRRAWPFKLCGFSFKKKPQSFQKRETLRYPWLMLHQERTPQRAAATRSSE
jgi:hypothetical protein